MKPCESHPDRQSQFAGTRPNVIPGIVRSLRKTATIVLTAVRPVIGDAQQAPRAAGAALVFDGVTVVDVEHGTLLPAQRVVIVGNRIQTMGTAGSVKVPARAQVVDAQGKYLIPGLWDMHVHARRSPQIAYPLLLANGMTGVRDMGLKVSLSIDSARRWEHEILLGVRVGPRVIGTGPVLDGSASRPEALAIETPDEGRRVVDSLRAAGADFIKPYSGLSREVYFAIAAEAWRIGVPLAGHLPRSVSAEEASDSGQRSIEHAFGVAGDKMPCGIGRSGDSAGEARCAEELAKRFARNGTWWTPTLTVYDLVAHGDDVAERVQRLGYWPKAELDLVEQTTASLQVVHSMFPNLALNAGNQVAVLRRAGMKILAGTDGGGVLLGKVQTELALLVQAGLTPLEALQAATRNPAQFLNGTDSLGAVAPGKLADLVLLDGDPLTDITNTNAIRAVVVNGRYFDRAALDQILADLRSQATQSSAQAPTDKPKQP